MSKEETIEKAKTFANSEDYNDIRSFADLRAVTNRKLGYDALPTAVTQEEFEEMAKKSTVYYRGVHSGNGKTASEIVDEFKYGNLWTGNSGGAVYGNGVYFTATESIASGSEYSGIDGVVFEMIIKKDAKIADYKKILTEYIETGIPKVIGEKEDYQQILGDIGQYAAVKGYDAIALNGFQNHDYVVLLNRGKAVVKGWLNEQTRCFMG